MKELALSHQWIEAHPTRVDEIQKHPIANLSCKPFDFPEYGLVPPRYLIRVLRQLGHLIRHRGV